MGLGEALERAAALWGIETGYWDVWGRRHDAPAEVIKSILESLGVPAGDEAALAQAVEGKLLAEWASPLPPTLVAGAGQRTFEISLPAARDVEQAEIEIQWETGERIAYSVSLSDLPVAAVFEFSGRRFERRSAPLPAEMPLGYHRLRFSGGTLAGETNFIVAPARAYLPDRLAGGGKAAGITVSLYSLRSSRNWGCGDLTDLENLAEWAARELRVAFIGLNPLHAIHNRQPFNTSPYLPNSIFFRNPIYLDVERLEDFRASRRAQALFQSPEIQQEIAALRNSHLVEYERVYALKLRFLKLCFDTFRRRCRAGHPERLRFEQYCKQEGELLERFAIYCALDEWLHQNNPEIWIWPQWPSEYQDPNSEAVRRFARLRRSRIQFYKYVQWRLDEQIASAHRSAVEKGLWLGLYHDLALATDSCGSDLWAHRPFFLSGCRVGAPPDDFSPQGQDWGFPPPNPARHRADGYRLFAESLRRSMRHGGALRIDHVMRFFRLFNIPEGRPAAEGTYVRADHEDLVRVLALESVRNQVLIVGEDLGTVAPEIRQALQRFGILSYRLLYFERTAEGDFKPPAEYPRQALVSVTTHDLATLAGFWLSRDIEARHAAGLLGSEEIYRAQLAARARDKQKLLEALRREGLLPEWFPPDASALAELTGELHNAVVGFLARTPSMLLLLNQEDLTKETEQQNLPGSTWQYPNWRRKMRFSIEELNGSPQARDFALMFRNWLEQTGRAG